MIERIYGIKELRNCGIIRVELRAPCHQIKMPGHRYRRGNDDIPLREMFLERLIKHFLILCFLN